ncbi:MAG: bifunctional methylenetetrahydrofolate dehydrogenase/methenyltetrahydrofolate cyclohydrolase FolD [Pirellulaceae bacterium]
MNQPRILDGKAIAQQIQQEIALQVAEIIGEGGATPTLAAVLVGEDPASEVYIRNKRRACERVGMESQLHRLPATATEDELLAVIARLNKDEGVHGILVQLPLPGHIRSSYVLDAVRPFKDVDCFHPENVGLLSQGRPRYLPCTPHGVQQLLYRSQISVAGQHVVIVGRSDIVGRPLALMLAAKESAFGPSAANATVTLCHSRTTELARFTRQADVLIAAVGRAELIKADMVREGAVVIDVGVNRIDRGLVGDVDFASVSQVASAITPVPGGVGPLTVTMLLKNTLLAASLP